MNIMTAATGSAALASALETGLTADALWGAITPFAGLIVTLVVFAFGYRVFRRVLSGSNKGKAKG